MTPKLTNCCTCIHKKVCIKGDIDKCAEGCSHYINEDTIANLRKENFDIRQNSVHINSVEMLMNEKTPAPAATDTSEK